MAKIRLLLSLFTIMCFLSGCNAFKAWYARKFEQQKLSDGISRLSAQHLTMIVKELNGKFEAPFATMTVEKFGFDHEAANFGRGEITWTINGLDIDYPDETVVYTNCHGEQATWQGRVHIISATRTIKGYLTNNPAKPIIPDPGSIIVQAHLRADNLAIKFKSNGDYLKIGDGEMSFTALPRLATAQKGVMSGLRTVPTTNTRFENVKLLNIQGELYSEQVDMPITIDDADLFIQVGIGEDAKENVVLGKMSLFGNRREIPSDGLGLDPKYDREKFKRAFSCHEDLDDKVAYDHVPFERKLAAPTAGLTAVMMGVLAQRFEEDEQCGMSSPPVLKNILMSEEAGAYGDVVNESLGPCSYNFVAYQTKPNCLGKAYLVNGNARILWGSKKVTGLIASNFEVFLRAVSFYELNLASFREAGEMLKKRPVAVLPSRMQAAVISLSAEFDGLAMQEICLGEGKLTHPNHCKNLPNRSTQDALTFSIFSGKADATFKPVLAKQMDASVEGAGFCSVKLPVGDANLQLIDIKAKISRAGSDLLTMASGQVDMTSGLLFDRENQLRGELTVGDVLVPLSGPTRSHSPLDAAYDRQLFADSYLSCNKIAVPRSDEDCRPEAGLSANIGRLLVMNAGSLIKLASSPSVPGSFASMAAVANRRLKNNETILELPALLDSPLDLPDSSNVDLGLSSDDLGLSTSLSGRIDNFAGTMHRRGMRLNRPTMVGSLNVNVFSNRFVEALYTQFNNSREIFVRPLQPDATNVMLTARVLDFATKQTKQGRMVPEPYLRLKSASFTINATPMMGIDERTVRETKPSYSIPTPIVKFDRVLVKDAKLILRNAHGLFLPLYVGEADLRAFNGKFRGEGNYIGGEILFKPVTNFTSVSNEDQTHMMIERQSLVPNFDQSLFDSSYGGTPNLYSILPHE